jgi:hypothetical protein
MGVWQIWLKAERLEVQMAEVCGMLHASTAWLVRLIGRVLETEAWNGFGIRTAEQWVAWKCGVPPRRARVLVRMARRLGELPETKAAFDSGELGEDSLGVICGSAPTEVDADVAELAKNTTVTQLRRVLTEYRRADEAEDAPEPENQRSVSFGSTDTGTWRLSAELPADEGAVWEKALTEARDELFKVGEAGPGPGPSPADVSWADAFVAVAETSLAAGAVGHPHRDRTMVLLHVGTRGGHLHLGPRVRTAPSGEPLDPWAIYLNEPAPARETGPRPAPSDTERPFSDPDGAKVESADATSGAERYFLKVLMIFPEASDR